MTPALSLLANFKWLRGTALDPFGRSTDRKLDRELIVWYLDVLDKVSKSFSLETTDKFLNILSSPMEIRGYGPVREKAAEDAKHLVAEALSSISAS